jgi:hypothetical protein
MHILINHGKSSPKMRATSAISKKIAQSKLSPNERKFAQFGHPVWGQHYNDRFRLWPAIFLKNQCYVIFETIFLE